MTRDGVRPPVAGLVVGRRIPNQFAWYESCGTNSYHQLTGVRPRLRHCSFDNDRTSFRIDHADSSHCSPPPENQSLLLCCNADAKTEAVLSRTYLLESCS